MTEGQLTSKIKPIYLGNEILATFATDRQNTTVRVITPADSRAILRLLDTAWQVYLRLSPLELEGKLAHLPGYLAEDYLGLRGFMIIEPHPIEVAFLLAAGLRDTWHPRPYLDLLLPAVEAAARIRGLSKLVYIGNAVWLIQELKKRDFRTQEWVVTLERSSRQAPPTPPQVARLRPVTAADLPSLSALDALTFNEIWHHAIGDIADALDGQDSFVLAEFDGRIVGYEWCELFASHAHVSRLAVQPTYQGRGIGGQLLHRAIGDALSRGLNHITLNTQENNFRSLALYRRYGFETTPERMPLLLKEL